MDNPHVFKEVLRNKMVRVYCGRISFTFRCVANSKLSSSDGQGTCDECLDAYYKDVSPDLDLPLLIDIETQTSQPAVAA